MEPKAIQSMAIDVVQCPPQARKDFKEEPLVGLTQSIAECGILQPLLVRREGGNFVCLDGERRLRAARRAGLTTVPVIVDDRELSPFEVTLRQLVVNTQREDLTPVERAKAIASLIKESGWTGAELSRRTGFSVATISRLTALLTLPPEIQQRVDAGEIPASTAYQIAIAGDGETQARLANEVAANGLTRDAVTARRRTKRTRQQPKRNRGGMPRVVVPIGGGRSVTVAGPDLSLKSLIEWLEQTLTRLRALGTVDLNLADAIARLDERPEALNA